MNPGIAYASAPYILWGVFPLFLGLLRGIPALEVMMHRIVWTLLLVSLSLLVLQKGRWIADVARSPRVLLRYALSAALIAINWFVYIWAVTHGHVVDASLGYFVTPLISVLLGRVVLGERPRPVQWVSVVIAASGVLWLALQAGHVPWIGLVIGATFGAYGLAKKTAPLGALEGLTVETALLFPFAVVTLAWMAAHGQNAWAASDARGTWLLVATGPVTALPLLLFAAGARRLPLATLGLLQYVSPTLQLLIGVLVYGEAFGRSSLIGYALIWAALALYAADGLARARRAASPKENVPEPA